MSKGIWAKLGNYDVHTQDNWAWANLWTDEMGEREGLVFKDEFLDNMPYGHHQIGVFS